MTLALNFLGGRADGTSAYQGTDVRGHFSIDGLAPGEYEVVAQVYVFGSNHQLMSDRQHVSLAEGGDMTVTLTLDLGALPKGGRP